MTKVIRIKGLGNGIYRYEGVFAETGEHAFNLDIYFKDGITKLDQPFIDLDTRRDINYVIKPRKER